MTGAAGPAAALAAAGAGRSLKPPAISLSPEVVLHDRCNLVALPIVGGLVLAGLLGAVDTLLVSCRGQSARLDGGRRGRRVAVRCCLLCRCPALHTHNTAKSRHPALCLTGHQGLHPVHCGRLFLHPAGAQGGAFAVRRQPRPAACAKSGQRPCTPHGAAVRPAEPFAKRSGTRWSQIL